MGNSLGRKKQEPIPSREFYEQIINSLNNTQEGAERAKKAEALLSHHKALGLDAMQYQLIRCIIDNTQRRSRESKESRRASKRL